MNNQHFHFQTNENADFSTLCDPGCMLNGFAANSRAVGIANDQPQGNIKL